jgi:hypothetical protein
MTRWVVHASVIQNCAYTVLSLLFVLLTQENLPPLRKAEGFAGGQAVGVH